MTNNTQRLIKTAVLLAIATVLSVIKMIELPFGGTITPASMMPVVIIAFMYGTRWGIFSALVYSILQMLTGMNIVSAMFMPGEAQMVLWQAICVCFIDYVLAFTALGLGGVFKNKFKNDVTAITLGTLVATFGRYVMHIVSGYIFYGAWAEWFFTQEGFYAFGAKLVETLSGDALSLAYSVIYNGFYMLPEIIITTILTPIVYGVIKKAKLN